MAVNSNLKSNELRVSLLDVDESQFDQKPIQQLPDTACGKLWYKPVSVPVCGTCFVLAAVITTSILVLQNCVPQFNSYWIQWHYIDDFHLSQIYTTQNFTHFDYNNQTLLNHTIFSGQNNSGIKMYDFLEIVIELNSEETLDDIYLVLQPENQSISEEVGIKATSEFYARDVYYDGTWYGLNIDYITSDNDEFITILSKPAPTACNFFEEEGCYTSNKYRIKINNQIDNGAGYDVLSLTLKSHKNQLYKIENIVFCVIFGASSLFNIFQWVKIRFRSKWKSFQAVQPFKFKSLAVTTTISIYWMIFSALGISTDEKVFTQSEYYSIRVIVIAFSFYLCFVGYASRLYPFITVSWAFISAEDKGTFNHRKKIFNFFTRCAVITFSVLLIFSILAVTTGYLLRIVNGAAALLSWFIIFYIFFYGALLIWSYGKIYLYVMIADTQKIFHPYLFHIQRQQLLKKYIFNFYMLELFIFMMYGFYITLTINYRIADRILCYYLSIVSVYCIVSSYFNDISLMVPWKCPDCLFEEQIAGPRKHMLCKVCSGYQMYRSQQLIKIEANTHPEADVHNSLQNEENNQSNKPPINMKNMNVVISDGKKSAAPKDLKMFEVDALNNHNNKICDAECSALIRINQLCDVFGTGQAEEVHVFLSIFEELTDYSLTMLIDDYIHLLRLHKLETMSNFTGPCENMENCSILQSRLRNIDVGIPLLVRTMKQIHCHLFHNAHQMHELRKRRFLYMSNQQEKVDELKGDEPEENEVDEAEEVKTEVVEEAKTEEKQDEFEEIIPNCMICGSDLSQGFPKTGTITCSICAAKCDNNQIVYRCKNISGHSNGFNLCQKCGLFQFKMEKFKREMDEKQSEEKLDKYDKYRYYEYKFGSFIYYDLLKPKFWTFKQELLNNDMYRINIDKWNDIFEKAKVTINTFVAREYVDLRTGRNIGIQHIISMICYTDYDALCYNFRNSFRKLDPDENERDVMKRHCNNYYHLGKWLNDAIGTYGSLVSKYKMPLYHGLAGHFLFESLCTDFNIPTSATTEISVAQNFTANEGLILQFDSKWRNGSVWDKAQCLSVEWLSSHSWEREVLFFGNFNQLRIVNIIFTSYQEEKTDHLKIFLQSISLWEMICDGYVCDSDANVEHDKLTYQILHILIKASLLNDQSLISNDNAIPHYVMKLFRNICEKREFFTLQGIWNMYWQYEEAENKEQLSEVSNLLDVLMENVTEEEIFENIRCKCRDTMIKKIITKKNWCDGCRDINKTKNMMGFHCKNSQCDYCLHTSCAKIVVNMKMLLLNAVQQHAKMERLDEIKANALKIELLRSTGLW